MSDPDDEHSETREYASPACFLHELAPEYGLEPVAQNACSQSPVKAQDRAQEPDSEAPQPSAEE